MKYQEVSGGICAPKGFAAAGVHCGIRANRTKYDLALIKAEVRCAAAGVYTTNKVCGAPIKVDRAHLADGAWTLWGRRGDLPQGRAWSRCVRCWASCSLFVDKFILKTHQLRALS